MGFLLDKEHSGGYMIDERGKQTVFAWILNRVRDDGVFAWILTGVKADRFRMDPESSWDDGIFCVDSDKSQSRPFLHGS